jgi:hypothetical protein
MPVHATQAILEAFDDYQIVGMIAQHGLKDVNDFVFALVRDPAFPATVDDIVVESISSLYQPALDRYIAGEDVPFSEVQKAWRNGSRLGGLESFPAQFVPLIRRINQTLPPATRMRLIAGEPPIDWDEVGDEEGVRNYLGSGIREESLATILDREVFAKGRKALVLYGTGHLFHNWPNTAIGIYERNHPRIFVIDSHGAYPACPAQLPQLFFDVEARMKAWPVPAIARVSGTWLQLLDQANSGPFPPPMQGIDAYLYLGPVNLLMRDYSPAHAWLDSAFIAEIERRSAIPGSGAALSRRQQSMVDAAAIREQASNPMLCPMLTARP